MSERENILGRIRKALTSAAPPSHATEPTGAASPGTAPRRDPCSVLPAVGATFDENLELFRRNAAELKADFHLVEDLEAVRTRVAALRDAEGWKRVASHRGSLTDAVCGGLGLPTCLTDGGYDPAELEACDAGLTECDALIAQTGSVLVTSRSAGGRALSVLPPHHLVLARRAQLLPGLPEAFSLVKAKYAPNYPSLISLITGPSRTGDIERVLVLGAHGPRKLTILCF